MSALTFQGDAFSEYYLTRVVWDDPKVRNLLGLDTVNASYRRAASELLRAERMLRDRHMPRSTTTLLLNPLAEIMGWTLGEEEAIQTEVEVEDAGSALLVDGRPFARVVALGPDAHLDLPPLGHHRRFAPTLSIVRVLEEQNLTWGILLNRFELRLIRRAEGFISSHIAFDLTSIAAGSPAGFDAWRVLWALLRQDALANQPSVLDRIVTIGREHQEGVSRALGGQVQRAVIEYLQGIISHPDNRPRIPQPLTPEFLHRLYAESLRVLYRMLFALYGESRGLLPDLPTYREGYSITRLARRAVTPESDPRRVPTSSGRYYEHSLKAVFELLRFGADLGPEGKIPMYDGALFDHSRTELVESLVWGDNTVANVLQRLTMVETESGLVHLSYRELDVEQLGAIYENLLEQSPQVASETMYKVSLDGRELWVNGIERARLAERRGEAPSGLTSDASEEENQDEEEPDEPQEEPAEEAEEPTEDLPTRSRKPIKVLFEIPAGTVYLKAGMGRKQSGSYYTSRPLVEFLVREAIDPLAKEKTPEEILSLRVVDPAMGSGHFLVGACRRLSEHLLAAYRKRYQDIGAANPEMPPNEIFNEAGIHPEVALNWDYEDRTLTACRLLIAGNCLYGVDKNPLAVDLAGVSLWLATAATDHPLTFLDHRLRVGDSLVGLPLFLGEGDQPEAHLLKPEFVTQQRAGRGRRRRMVEAPLLAGISAEEVVSEATARLRERIGRAFTHLHSISRLMNDSPGDFVGQRAAFDAMQSELRPFWNLHELRIGQVFLPPSSVEEADLVNRWLADIAKEGEPSDEIQALSEDARKRGKEMGAFCWMLAFPEVFFTPDGLPQDRSGFDTVIGNPPWDKIKPNERECFSDFDPTVWDVQGQERKRLIARIIAENPLAEQAWQKHESDVKTLSKYLLEGGIYHHQIAEIRDDDGKTKKTGGDPDSFKFFTERAYQLLRNGGRAGIIVPLGIQGSLGTTALRRLLLDHCTLAALCKLDNERYIFPGVFHGQKFDLLVFGKGGRTATFEAAFLSWETADVTLRLRSDPRHVTIDADLYRELSPEQYIFVELHDQREVELLRRIYRRFPRLGERIENTWNVSYVREFDMTNDSFLFRDAARLKEMGATLHSRLPSPTVAAEEAPFEPDDGGEFWTTPNEDWYRTQPTRFTFAERQVDSRGRVHMPGELEPDRIAYVMQGYIPIAETNQPAALPVIASAKYVPLYEGRMVHQFDHSQKAYLAGSGRRARWEEMRWNEKRIVPHYFMAAGDFEAIHAGQRIFRPGFCDVTGQVNERTVLSSIVPSFMPCGNKVPTVRIAPANVRVALFWTAIANSFVCDWLMRLRVSNSLNFFIWDSFPMERQAPGQPDFDAIVRRAGKLSCTTIDMQPLWEYLAEAWQDDFPQPWTHENACLDVRRRAQLRAEIDALVARIYGLSSTEYARVLSTFPLLDQDQPPLAGDVFIRTTNKGEKIEARGFITRDLALLAFFELLGQEPPRDVVVFFREAGIDIDRQTGSIRDLRERVGEATRRGAVAYLPSTGKGWSPSTTSYLPPDLPEQLTANWEANIGQFIVEDEQRNAGEPTLRSTRISTSLIYDLLNRGWTFRQVLESYPHLTAQQVAVALRWGQLQ